MRPFMDSALSILTVISTLRFDEPLFLRVRTRACLYNVHRPQASASHSKPYLSRSAMRHNYDSSGLFGPTPAPAVDVLLEWGGQQSRVRALIDTGASVTGVAWAQEASLAKNRRPGDDWRRCRSEG